MIVHFMFCFLTPFIDLSTIQHFLHINKNTKKVVLLSRNMKKTLLIKFNGVNTEVATVLSQ